MLCFKVCVKEIAALTEETESMCSFRVVDALIGYITAAHTSSLSLSLCTCQMGIRNECVRTWNSMCEVSVIVGTQYMNAKLPPKYFCVRMGPWNGEEKCQVSFFLVNSSLVVWEGSWPGEMRHSTVVPRVLCSFLFPTFHSSEPVVSCDYFKAQGLFCCRQPSARLNWRELDSWNRLCCYVDSPRRLPWKSLEMSLSGVSKSFCCWYLTVAWIPGFH